ncbi:hypothetical protein [Conexibacter sp. SYSU D00693]|uniref:hypothetical protein n=1 Tax=Conexibacter sp. SYSU D00693 TaxID=2812560 RepID=UPI00196B9753|nr:hypothetical protein [Conexibacter sp. SYSU D00693]
MESSRPARVLVVAHRTAATPALLDAVRRRAAEGPARFTLLVPNPAHGLHRAVDPEDHGRDEAQVTVGLAVPLLEEAAGSPVESIVGVASPIDAVADALHLHGPFDEVLVSTLPRRLSRWLHMDLPAKLNGFGLPVTTVTAKATEREAQPA